MSNKKLAVSVLIPTMNRPKALERTLKSYLSAKYIPCQIVVVDQSEKKMQEKVKQVVEKYRNIVEMKYVYQEEASLTKARNTAFGYAKAEIIICSDDDIDVYEDTVKNVYDFMQNRSFAMIAGIDDNMTTSSSKIGYFLGTKSFINKNKGHVTLSMLGRFPNEITENTQTMWAMGFFFVIRKSLVENWKIKWDEKLIGYAYAEDLDFSYSYYKKAKKECLKCVMSSNIHVKHLASQEFRTPSRKSTFMYVIHRAYLSYKHQMGWKSELAMRWCNLGIYFERRIKNNCSQDMKDAMHYLKKHRSEIRKGEFNF
ncbi:hypothetical protein HMPREF9477_01869 [Lachnospiraceae bacterium 2_1_46FAA]|nr:hypothetical protein HMPREF9477_01869 [Lachnospiraceae bacterium 2_1_46FAA]